MRFLWTLGALGYLSGCTGVFTVKPQDETGISRANERPTASDLLLETDEDSPISFRLAGYDADLDPLTYSLTEPDPEAGILSGTAPDLSFAPAADFTSPDPVTFTYTVSDGTKESLPATVSILVKNVNDAPVATDLTVATQEEVDTLIDLLATDVEDTAAGLPLVYAIQNDPAFGSLDVSALPQVVYRSNDDFSGLDSFTYFATDSGGARSGYATVSITVSDVNDAPVPGADAYVMDEDTVLTRNASAGLLANDTNLEDDTLEVASSTEPVVDGEGDPGVLNVNTDGSFTYTPAQDFSGSVSFSYVLTDGAKTVGAATPVTIEVESVPDAPRIVDEPSYAVTEDTAFTADVLDDCSSPNAGLLCAVVDPDLGDEVAVSLSDTFEPEHAQAFEINADGSFSYTPEEDYTGFDEFQYRVIDGGFLVSEYITVTLSVSPQNDPPRSAPDSYTVDEDGELVVGFGAGLLLNDSDVDGDELSVSTNSDPVVDTGSGTDAGVLNVNANGTFVYTPAADFYGDVTFTYVLTDGTVLKDPPETVSITVLPQNDPPTAGSLTYTGVEDELLVIDAAAGLLSAAIDVDAGDTLTATLESGVTIEGTEERGGTVTVNPDGSFTLNPERDLNGALTFLFSVSDGTDSTDPVAVIVTLDPRNDAPVASGNLYEMLEDDGPLVVGLDEGLLANDEDVDEDGLSTELVSDVSNGVLTLAADGSFTYDPAADYFGSDVFTYRAFDGTDYSEAVEVTVVVAAVNDAPVAVPDSQTGLEDEVLNVSSPGVLSNDYDVDDLEADALRVELRTTPLYGSVVLDGDGGYRYTPDENSNKLTIGVPGVATTDSFTYLITDVAGEPSDEVAVTLTIEPVNDAPLALSDFYDVDEDTARIVAAPGVLVNDSDIDLDVLTATLVSEPSNGTLSFNTNGAFTYTPDLNYTGADTFIYTADDGEGGVSDEITVYLDVGNTNDAPVSVDDDGYELDEDSFLLVPAPGLLDNDTDGDGDPLTAVLASPPSNGTVSLSANGQFTYEPAPNFNGEDTFLYNAYDGKEQSVVASTVRILVNAVNDSPVAVDDTYTGTEDTPLTRTAAFGLLANDADLDGDSISVTATGVASEGSVTVEPDGSFTYTPTADFNGTATFEYTIADPDGEISVATATLNIEAVNDNPVGVADAYETNEDEGLTKNAAEGVLSNDTDVDVEGLRASLVASPSFGTLSLGDSGAFLYVPEADFIGEDTFVYQAIDTAGGTSDPVTVTITVTSVNDAPIVSDDAYDALEDTPLSVNAASGVLANDSDIDFISPDGDELAVYVVSAPTHGSLTLATDGSFTYEPDGDFNGVDTFEYVAEDLDGSLSESGLVVLSVAPVNDAPVGSDDTYTVAEDGLLTVTPFNSLLANDDDVDGDDLYVVLPVTTLPDHGLLLELNDEDGTFIYQPDADFNGTDSFTYQAKDREGSDGLVSSVHTVTITVTAVDDAPVAVDDSYTTNEDETLSELSPGVLSNDSDVEDDALTAELRTTPASGDVTLNADGSFAYVPDADFFGDDSFTYIARANGLAAEFRTVSVEVLPVNDPAVANDDYFSTPEDTLLTGVSVLTNDVDIDTDAAILSVYKVSDPTMGALTLNADGTFTYQPDAGETGIDTFTYRVDDGSAVFSDVATVTIDVGSVNDAPVGVADGYFVDEDETLSVDAAIGVLDNDSDADGDDLSATVISSTINGVLTFSSSGAFTYVPNSDYNGSDQFTYQATDGIAATDIVVVAITVAAVNDAPIANDDSYDLVEEGSLSVVVLDGGVLDNDTDLADGISVVSELSAELVLDVTKGSLSLSTNGSFTYTPNENAFGVDTFTYRIPDGDLYSNTATVTLNIAGTNDAPMAMDDAHFVEEDTTLSVTDEGDRVLSNDEDVDGDALTASYDAADNEGPDHGSVTMAPNGSFTYVPDANFYGTDSFTYDVSDGSVADTATVTITVGPVDDAPVALGETLPLAEDTSLTLAAPGVLENEVNVDPEDTLTVTLVEDVTSGSLALAADGSLVYTPTTNFYGDDSFTYTVTDGVSTVGPVTAILEVSNVNDAPNVGDVNYDVTEDTTLSVGVADGVLQNTTDADGTLDTLTVSVATLPAGGVLSLNTDGSFVFEPTTGWSTNDSFTFTVSDGVETVTGTAILDFDAVNDAPVASPRTFETDEDVDLVCEDAGCLLDPTYVSDSDDALSSLFAKKISDPVNGTVTLDDAAAGYFTYTPNANFNGTDSFSYAVSDGLLDSATMLVTIVVDAVNDAPTSVDDTYETAEDTDLTIGVPGVLTNDSDVEGDALSVSVVDDGDTFGSVTLNTDGSFVYTPDAEFFGADRFEYKVSDGSLSSSYATVTVNVIGDDDVPVGFDDDYEVIEDTFTEFDRGEGVLANDTDADDDTLYLDPADPYTGLGPTLGALTFFADGSFTYAPNANEDGDRDGSTCDDTFAYSFTDGLYEASATVCIRIQPVNDAPVALDDTAYVVNEDQVLNSPYSVLDNDTDVEGDTLRIASDEFGSLVVEDVAFGSLTLSEDGNFVYTPDPNYTGSDSFTYRVKDCVDAGCSFSDEGNLATVTIDVAAVPDTPSVSDLTLEVAEDGSLSCATTPCVTIEDEDFGYTEEIGDHTFEVTDDVSHGSLALASDGTYTYTPTANYYGSDSFGYRVTGTDGEQDEGVATITVNSQDDAPVCEGLPTVTGGSQDLSAEVRYQVGVGWTCEAHAGDWDDNAEFAFGFTWELDSDGDGSVDDTLSRSVDVGLADELASEISPGSGLYYRTGSALDTLEAGAFATMKRGDKVQCLVSVDDTVDNCGAQSAVVDVENARPMLHSASIDVVALTVDDDLVCNAVAEDLDGDNMTYTFTLTGNGVGTNLASEDVTTADNTASATFDLQTYFAAGDIAKGDTLECTVTLSDGIDTAFDVESDSVAIVNALPTVSVEITAADGGDLDRVSTARCSAVGLDADGDDVEYRYVWLIDGFTRNQDYSTSAFMDVDLSDYGNLERGESVQCTVTPRDDDNAGVPVTQIAVVVNALPYIDSIDISTPGGVDPTITSTLSCDAVGADHDAGDAVTLSYAWGVTGLGAFPTETSSTTDLSAFSTLSKGDEVYCTATPFDDNEPADPGTADTATVTLVNETPTVDAVAVTVSGGGDAWVTSTLDCTASGVADADEDDVTVTFVWTSSAHALEYAGGAVVASSGVASVSVDVGDIKTAWLGAGASVQKGDTLTCTASTDDGTINGGGESASGDATLKNSLPVAGTVSITAGNRGDTVTCSVAGSTDADGDDLRFEFDWSIDGVPVANSGWTALGTTSATLDLTNEPSSAEGLDVACTATPDDDGEAGDASDDEDHSIVGTSSSGTMTIDNAPPTVSVTLDGPSSMGASLTCNATITDLDLDAQSVTLTWSIDTGAGFVSATPVPSTIAAAATSPTTGTVSSTVIVGTDLLVTEGQSMKCTVSSDDGTDSDSAESVKVVGDSIPVMHAELTSDLSPVTGDSEFTCTADVFDADAADTVAATFDWSVGGAILFTETVSAASGGVLGTVTSSQTAADLSATKGQVVTCTLTAQDQDGVDACDVDDASSGSAVCNTDGGGLTLTESVASLTLENHVPEITDVQISTFSAGVDPSLDNFDFTCDVSLVEYDLTDTVSLLVRLQVDPASGADAFQFEMDTVEIVRDAGDASIGTASIDFGVGGSGSASKIYMLDASLTVYEDAAAFIAAGGTVNRGDAMSCVVTPFEGSTSEVDSFVDTGAPSLVSGAEASSSGLTLLNSPPAIAAELVVTAPLEGTLSDDSTLECQVNVADRDGDTGTLSVELTQCDEACQLCVAACGDIACDDACRDSLESESDAGFETLHLLDDCGGAGGLSTCGTSYVTTHTLDPATVETGDEIRCVASFDDANGETVAVSAAVSVDNDAPAITSVAWRNGLDVLDSTAPIDESMTCRVDVSDANSASAGASDHIVTFTFYEAADPATILLSASQDASALGSTASDRWTSYTLFPQDYGLAKGEQLVCAATVTDGDYTDSISAESTATLSLVNDVPDVITNTLAVNGALVGDDVSCSVIVNEVDGDNLCARFEMTVSNDLVSTQNFLAAVPVTSNSAVQYASVGAELSAVEDNSVVCNVDIVELLPTDADCSAMDSTNVEAADSSRVVGSLSTSNPIGVGNSATELISVTLDNLSPFITDTLTCTFSPFDADYEVLDYTMSWQIDGITVWEDPGTTDTVYSDVSHDLTLSDYQVGGEASKGDSVQCVVTVGDEGVAASLGSAVATIQDSAPVVSDDGTGVVFEAFDGAGSPIDESAGDVLTREGSFTCTVNFTEADNDTVCARFEISQDEVGIGADSGNTVENYNVLSGIATVSHTVDMSAQDPSSPLYPRGYELTCRADVQQGPCDFAGGTPPGTGTSLMSALVAADDSFTIVNAPPDAVDDNVEIAEDSGLYAGDVSSNDVDLDNDLNGTSVSYTNTSSPSNGAFVFNSDGTFTFTPDVNFNGVETFTYEVDDGNGGSDTATVTLTVTSVNDVPNFGPPKSYDWVYGASLVVPAVSSDRLISGMSDSDGTLTVQPGEVMSNVANARVVLTGDGSFAYHSENENTITSDTFNYTVKEVNDVGAEDTHVRTATINFVSTENVWYVDNSHGLAACAGKNGHEDCPFTTLVEAETASDSNDVIYVKPGDGTSTGQDEGIALQAGQRLVGAGVALEMGGVEVEEQNLAEVSTISSIGVDGLGVAIAIPASNSGKTFTVEGLTVSGGYAGVGIDGDLIPLTDTADSSTTFAGTLDMNEVSIEATAMGIIFSDMHGTLNITDSEIDGASDLVAINEYYAPASSDLTPFFVSEAGIVDANCDGTVDKSDYESDHFLELYNNGVLTKDLKDYVLGVRSGGAVTAFHTFGSGDSIAPGGTFVVFGDDCDGAGCTLEEGRALTTSENYWYGNDSDDDGYFDTAGARYCNERDPSDDCLASLNKLCDPATSECNDWSGWGTSSFQPALAWPASFYEAEIDVDSSVQMITELDLRDSDLRVNDTLALESACGGTQIDFQVLLMGEDGTWVEADQNADGSEHRLSYEVLPTGVPGVSDVTAILGTDVMTYSTPVAVRSDGTVTVRVTNDALNACMVGLAPNVVTFRAHVFTCWTTGTCTASSGSRIDITGVSGASAHCATQPSDVQFDVVDDSMPAFGSGSHVVFADPSGRVLSSLYLPDSEDTSTDRSELSSCYDASAATTFGSVVPGSNQGFGAPYEPTAWSCEDSYGYAVHPGWLDDNANVGLWGTSVGIFTGVTTTGECDASMNLTNVTMNDLGIGVYRREDISLDSCTTCTSATVMTDTWNWDEVVMNGTVQAEAWPTLASSSTPLPLAIIEASGGGSTLGGMESVVNITDSQVTNFGIGWWSFGRTSPVYYDISDTTYTNVGGEAGSMFGNDPTSGPVEVGAFEFLGSVASLRMDNVVFDSASGGLNIQSGSTAPVQIYATDTEAPYWRFGPSMFSGGSPANVEVVGGATLTDATLGNTTNGGGASVVYDDSTLGVAITPAEFLSLDMVCDLGSISGSGDFLDLFDGFESGIWDSLPANRVGPDGVYAPIGYSGGEMLARGSGEYARLTTSTRIVLPEERLVVAGLATDVGRADHYIAFSESTGWEYSLTSPDDGFVIGWSERELSMVAADVSTTIVCELSPGENYELTMRLEDNGSNHKVHIEVMNDWGSTECAFDDKSAFFKVFTSYYMYIGADADGSGGFSSTTNEPARWLFLQVPGSD